MPSFFTLRWGLTNFFPVLALNCNPPYLSLPSIARIIGMSPGARLFFSLLLFNYNQNEMQLSLLGNNKTPKGESGSNFTKESEAGQVLPQDGGGLGYLAPHCSQSPEAQEAWAPGRLG
jgi:hypothetical protein